MVHINIYNHIRHLIYEKVLVPCSSIKIEVDDASNLYISNMVRTFISSINGKQKENKLKSLSCNNIIFNFDEFLDNVVFREIEIRFLRNV